MSTNNEWTTVSKKGGYVPPHMRAKADAAALEAEKNKPLDIASATMFPTLAGQKKAANTWEGPVSFKQKIDDLIAFEARSELEKEAEEEARRALEGFVRLPLRITPEFIKKYNDTLTAAVERELSQELVGSMNYWSEWKDNNYTVIDEEYETDNYNTYEN